MTDGAIRRARLLASGRQILSRAGADDPESDAQWLLCAAAGCGKAELAARPDATISDTVEKTYFTYIDRRVKKEPVQYIAGEWEFMGLPFLLNRDVLIPRSDTECLVEGVIRECGCVPAPRILDLCTGSGCIAISLAVLIRASFIVGTDISAQAVRVAKSNAALNGVSGRVTFITGDLYGAAAGYPPFDIICANPPYVNTGEYLALPDDVRLFEPRLALDGGADGLEFYRRITEGAARYLKPGGLLAVEAGAGQAGEVEAIFNHSGFISIRTVDDLRGVGRAVFARYPEF